MPKTFNWEKDSSHSIAAKETVPGEEGIRYVFESWSDGNTALSRTVTVTGPMTYSANYKTQYYLTVRSDQGDPSGEGWYDAGANAYATVEVSKVSADFLNDYVFKGWKGDARGSQPKSSAIKMDGPRTAEAIWEKQFSMNMYIIIAVAVAVPVAAVAWLKLKPSAKKREIKAPALVSPSSITCPQCGSSNTPDNSFCASCGKPLRPPGK